MASKKERTTKRKVGATKTRKAVKENKGQMKLPLYALCAEDLAKLTYKDLFEADPVELYIAICEKKIPKFPDKYWLQSDPELLNRVKPIIKYLLHDVLGWTKGQVEQEISCATFKKHKLVGLYNSFDSSTIKLLNTVTDYEYSVSRITSYDKKLSTIRKDLEWFVKKLIGEGLKSADKPIPIDQYIGHHVEYFINFRYFDPKTPLRDILANLHPELLHKYFTLKGALRKGAKVGK